MKKKRRTYAGFVVAAVLWVVVIVLVLGTQPGNLWWEMVVLSLTNLAVFLTVTNATRKPKWGVIVIVIVIGGLVLNRLGLLTGLSGGLLLVVGGLLSLID